jgi:hypothetical protein
MTVRAEPGEELLHLSGEPLLRALLAAPPKLLGRALDNPELEEEQLLLLLRRLDLDAGVLAEVADRPRWVARYRVKAALVIHPRTPKTVALNLAKHLFWRDLTRMVSNLLVDAAVRRMAEVLLRERLPEISLGERIALARVAPREIIKALRLDPAERVIAALLDNPRATEEDLVAMASSNRTRSAILALLARSEKWIARPAVRLALIKNPTTPAAAAMSLLPGLNEHNLKGLAGNAQAPAGVRRAALKLVEERASRRRSGR